MKHGANLIKTEVTRCLLRMRLPGQVMQHPVNVITALTTSESSAGSTYDEVCSWKLTDPIPEMVRKMKIEITLPGIDFKIVFSALNGTVAYEVEEQFSGSGHIVVSNASSHRIEPDVPLLIPEINSEHLRLLEHQKTNRGYKKGCIITNPNFSTIPLAIVLYLLKKRWGVTKVFVATLQAISGAGYPRIAFLDMLDNVIPYIKGEEKKIAFCYITSEYLGFVGKIISLRAMFR